MTAALPTTTQAPPRRRRIPAPRPLFDELAERPPFAMVTGGTGVSYGMIRSLGEAEIPVALAADDHAQPASASRYVQRRLRLPDPTPTARTCEALLDYARSFESPPLLLPHTEQWIQTIARAPDRFARVFRLPWPDPAELRLVLSKFHMHRWCRRRRFHVPEARFFTPGDDFRGYLRQLAAILPIVVKPETKTADAVGFDQPARYFDTVEALHNWASVYPERGPGFRLLAQRFIPGDARRLVAYHGYKAADGQIWMVGLRKVRTFPPLCGSATASAVVQTQQQSAHLARQMLQQLPYTGLFDIEFKYDPDREAWAFIELNPRAGLPSYIATAAGLNLPLLAYNDAIRRPLPPPTTITSAPLAWCDGDADRRAARALAPSALHAAINRWRSLRGRRVVHAYANLADAAVFAVDLRARLYRRIPIFARAHGFLAAQLKRLRQRLHTRDGPNPVRRTH